MLPKYIGSISSQYKDPYEKNSIVESKKVFFFVEAFGLLIIWSIPLNSFPKVSNTEGLRKKTLSNYFFHVLHYSHQFWNTLNMQVDPPQEGQFGNWFLVIFYVFEVVYSVMALGSLCGEWLNNPALLPKWVCKWNPTSLFLYSVPFKKPFSSR